MKLGDYLDERVPFLLLITLILVGSIATSYVEDRAIRDEGQKRFEVEKALFLSRLQVAEAKAGSIASRRAARELLLEEVRSVAGEFPDLQVSFLPPGAPVALPQAKRGGTLQAHEDVTFLGAEARLAIQTGPLFWDGVGTQRPVLILLGGIAIALLSSLSFLLSWRSRRSAEIASTQQRLSLAKSQARLRSIFDSAGDGICGIDQSGRIVFANAAAARIFARPAEKLHDCKLVELVSPGDAELEQALQSGERIAQEECTLEAADGREITIDIIANPMPDHEGHLAGSVVVLRDITARVQTERDLRAANAELEEFAYRTSHDLRSPLISSSALLKITQQSLAEGKVEPAQKSLAMTIGALEGLERLVGDILLLSQAKAAEEDDTEIDLVMMVQAALDKVENLDGFERLAVTVDCSNALPISSKESRVRLIIDNLISNAVKYQDSAQEQPSLRISTHTRANAILLVVEDNGLGIPADQHEDLFAMFKRFHPRTAFGSGLGLYMVKKSATLIGAKIGFEALPQGSRFTVAFPAGAALAEAA